MGDIKHLGTLALRKLAGGPGEAGEGPVTICLRVDDFQVIEVQGPQGPMPAPANTKVIFDAHTFREMKDESGSLTGCWELSVAVPTPSGEPARALVYIDGADILYVRASSRLV